MRRRRILQYKMSMKLAMGPERFPRIRYFGFLANRRPDAAKGNGQPQVDVVQARTVRRCLRK